MKRLLLLLLIVTLALAACGGGEDPTPTPAPEPTAAPTTAPEPTAEPEPTVEPTPIPEPTATPEPTAEPEPVIDLLTYDDSGNGYSLEYPADWFIQEDMGMLTIASAEELLDQAEPGEEGGLILLLPIPLADEESTDPVDLLNELMVGMDLGEDAEVIEGPTRMNINGQPSATAVLSAVSDNGTPLSAYLAFIVNNNNSVALIGATPVETTDLYMPQFQAIAQSIRVTELEVVIPEGNDEGILLYGDQSTGTVATGAESRWTFIGLAGETVDLAVNPSEGDLDVVIDITDPSGLSLFDAPLDDSFGREEVRGLTLPADGVYTIIVTGWGTTSGAYEIALTEAGAFSSDGGGVLFYGDVAEGTLTAAETLSWQFSGEARDFVDITVTPIDEDLDVIVDVVDSNGRSILPDGELDDSFDTEYVRVLRLPETGVYTILVRGYEESVGTFVLNLEPTNGGLPGTILFAYDTIEEESDESHMFPFNTFAGDVVTAYVNPELGFDVVLAIYNDDTGEWLDEVDASTGFEELSLTIPEDGNYYFLVSGFEGAVGEYEITLIGSVNAIFEVAYGDGLVGRFDESGFIEYSYGAFADEILTLYADTDDEIDLVIEIWDLDDNLIASVDEGLAGDPETLVHTFAAEDLYIIRISDFIPSGSGEFFLTVE